MTTLKEHLKDNKLSISDAQRFDLGYKLARLWDKENQGLKTHTIEDEFKVRNYPLSFINSESVSKLILDYLSDGFDELCNTF